MYLYTFLTLPSITSTLEGISETFNPWFAEMWPWALWGLGLTLVGLVIAWVSGAFSNIGKH